MAQSITVSIIGLPVQVVNFQSAGVSINGMSGTIVGARGLILSVEMDEDGPLKGRLLRVHPKHIQFPDLSVLTRS